MTPTGEVPGVFVVDPSLFTLPYDTALVRALNAAGIRARLVGRPPRRGEPAPSVPFVAAFYRRCDAAPRRFGAAGAFLKAVEHGCDLMRLAPTPGPTPTLLHLQWLVVPLLDRRAIARWRRHGPVVVTVHDTEPFNGSPTHPLQRRGLAAALASADRLIVHTQAGRVRLAAGGLPAGRIRTVPHGPLGPVAPPSPLPEQARARVVAFGKMRPYKGLDLLVAACARLDSVARAGLEVIIAGEPLIELAPLRAAIAAAGLEDTVTLVPRHLSEADAAALLASAAAFVFPYREIEASGVLYRVAGLGRWIVASRLGAFAEAIPAGAGRLVPPGDVVALAAALAEIARDRPRPSAPVAVTDWASIAAATRAVYAEALADWRGRAA